MSKFNLEKRISLEYLGEQWKECYLAFNSMSYRDVKEIIKLRSSKDESEMTLAVFDILKQNFKSGKSFDGKSVVDLEVTDLEEMPIDILAKVINQLVEGSEAKK